MDYRELQGRVVFEHVDFGYNPDKIVLHDVSLFAEPGQKIAFVGSTGAGKTTITNLINRFYDIQKGKIRYDEINIERSKRRSEKIAWHCFAGYTSVYGNGKRKYCLRKARCDGG